jgi:hypothetical protein
LYIHDFGWECKKQKEVVEKRGREGMESFLDVCVVFLVALCEIDLCTCLGMDRQLHDAILGRACSPLKVGLLLHGSLPWTSSPCTVPAAVTCHMTRTRFGQRVDICGDPRQNSLRC